MGVKHQVTYLLLRLTCLTSSRLRNDTGGDTKIPGGGKRGTIPNTTLSAPGTKVPGEIKRSRDLEEGDGTGP